MGRVEAFRAPLSVRAPSLYLSVLTLGTRLLVFDKVRDDPHEPQRYGATITYDIEL